MEIEKHIVAENLLNDLVAKSKGELTPFERIFIAEKLKQKYSVPIRALVDIYMDCGCFSEASNIYEQLRHWRKLGDLAWASNNLEEAKYYYSSPKNNVDETIYRSGPDWDRLIKLSFFNSDWGSVLRLLDEAQPVFVPDFKKIILGNSATSPRAYLEMAGICFSKLNLVCDKSKIKKYSKFFGISDRDFSKVIISKGNVDEAAVRSVQKKIIPRVTLKEKIHLKDAVALGNTSRARSILNFIDRSEVLVLQARGFVKTFIKNGKKKNLESFIKIVTKTEVNSLSQSFLFAVMENDGYDPQDPPFHRQAQLYGCHAVMQKRYFGRLLNSKFRGEIPLTGNDLLTGMLQQMSSIESSLKRDSAEEDLDFDQLISCKDWAEMKLEEWLNSEGKLLIDRVRDTWIKGKAVTVSKPWSSGKDYPNSPREMKEWGDMLDEGHKWLSFKWQSEIGISPWITENRLYELAKKAFKNKEVIRHAQPIWLAPQHLDIFVPELSLAIEYMGEQHYRPIDFFGGQAGFASTVERDGKKAEICHLAKIRLIYIRYDEDIASRIQEVRSSFASDV